MAVFQHFEIGMPYSIQNLMWGFNIGLPDIKMVNNYTLLFGSLRVWHQSPDWRRGHVMPAITYLWHAAKISGR
jgi:hypothetical protein